MHIIEIMLISVLCAYIFFSNNIAAHPAGNRLNGNIFTLHNQRLSRNAKTESDGFLNRLATPVSIGSRDFKAVFSCLSLPPYTDVLYQFVRDRAKVQLRISLPQTAANALL